MDPTELFVGTTDQRSTFRPGEVMEVSVLWALASVPRSIEARLCWFTRGKGTVDAGVVSTQTVPAPPAAGEQTLRFTLPDGPYSFSGKLISLIWAVELVAEPGARSTRFEFVLAPEGKERVLTPLPDAPRKR